MAYIIHKDKPYYYNGSKVFACSISANAVTVDFNNPVRFKDKIECVYTEDEIKRKLGIFMVDSWDAEKEKVVKVSNKTISSIPDRSKKA